MQNKNQSFARIKIACYVTNICMSAVIIVPALLFVPFRETFGISYTMLGFLTVINFSTQLLTDLVFSFYSHKFNIEKTVKTIPVIAALGFSIYAIMPVMFEQHAYFWLVFGTIIFSSASGLAEVLISPVIAAIPSENPDREMSKLHSVYAWGVVAITVVSTVVIYTLGSENWHILVLMLLIIPLAGMILFAGVSLPKMHGHERPVGVVKLFKNKSMWFCFFVIFFGGASENIISQWSSTYLEQALAIPKIWGDMVGVAFFAVMLGIGRSLYAKKGTNIKRTMFVGAIGATVCYLIIIFVDIPVITVVSCATIGYFVAMLWPGSLVLVQQKFPKSGVAIFALMAAGGDLGSSIGPQIMGAVADIVMQNQAVLRFGESFGYSAEQIGMKCGMAVVVLFPVLCAVLLGSSYFKKQNKDT